MAKGSKVQRSKRAREARKVSKVLGLRKTAGRPSHISGRAWARFQAPYQERTERELQERYHGFL